MDSTIKTASNETITIPVSLFESMQKQRDFESRVNTEVEKITKILVDRLIDKDKILSDKDKQMSDRLKDKDKMLIDKEKELHERLNDKERLINMKEKMLNEKDIEIERLRNVKKHESEMREINILSCRMS